MDAAALAKDTKGYLVAFFLGFFRTFGLSLSGLGGVVSPALRAPKNRRWVSSSLYVSSCERLGIDPSVTPSSKDIFVDSLRLSKSLAI